MNVISSEYYGDDVRWFVATVIDNSPPYGLEGRVQVRIHGIHSTDVNDIPQLDLPWAQVMSPSDTYGSSGMGTHCQILPGSLVFGMFLDGKHSQLPMVLGSLPRIEYPSSVQASGQKDQESSPFSYDFQQSNSQFQDPVFYNEYDPENTSFLDYVSVDVARFFIDNGYTAKQASCITGVLYSVSGLDSKFSSGYGLYGIAGWKIGSPRYTMLNAFIQRLSPSRSIDDFDGQLMFVLQELRTTKSIVYSKMMRLTNIRNLYEGDIAQPDAFVNGHVSVLLRHYIDNPLTDQTDAEGVSKSIYDSLGGR